MPQSTVATSPKDTTPLGWTSIDEPVRNFLKELGLSKYYIKKITIQDARRNARGKEVQKSDIPWSFLEKVLGLAYKGRGDFFQIINPDDMEEDFMELIQDFTFNEELSAEKEENYSFNDVRIAVFLCCNNICKKKLAEKLHMCHLSVPLLLPDISNKGKFVMQLWALRGMTEDLGFATNHVPIVSFVSVNGESVVKTKILNKLLADESFDTFFDTERESSRMNGATVTKLFRNGVIDAACFQPSQCSCENPGKCSCTFKKLIMFLNLYGICENYSTQKNLICKISTLVTIIVDAGDIDESVNDNITQIVDQSKQVLIVFTKDPLSSLQKCKEGIKRVQSVVKDTMIKCLFDRTNGRIFHDDRTKKIMKGLINQIMAKDTDTISLKNHFENVKHENVTTDQDERECTLGKKKAEEIYNKVKRFNISGIKEKVLPLQCGDMWQKWAEIERQMKGGKPEEDESYDHFIAGLYKEQQKLREKQVEVYKDTSNEIMQMFCSTLSCLESSSRSYFIQWLSFFLNDMSSSHTESLRYKLSSLREDKAKTTDVSDLQFKLELKQLEEEIKSVSFDIKHFFREIGQVYEAFNTSHNASIANNFSEEQLCKVVAQLFVEGFPLEIVDCKAKQIPTTFIQAVFGYVKDKVPEKVFILSVIGIQSSGKSTLLNAMFGTQFSTSVGLCTEGVNAQLIPMPSEIHSPKYKHVMLIDTKGLRSTDSEVQFGSYSRDNELATLLFGISDLTLLNMKGESKAEIDSILQVVIHALLNIKAVNKGMRLESKCLFIHHNVDASDAKNTLNADNTKFKETLDSVTLGVAERLGITEVKRFSDIIRFDVDDNKYFSNLWRGEPPMASINSGYSKKVKEVKDLILQEIIPNHQGHKFDVKTFSTRLKDIWDAIQGEDFVFCFRNHAEINAHEKLEGLFSDLRWSLNKTAIKTLRSMRDYIKKHPDDEETMVNTIKANMDISHGEAKVKLDNFFKSSDDGILLREWNVHYDKTLQKLKDEKITSSQKLLSVEIKIQKVQKDTSLRLDKWKWKARQKAIHYADTKLKEEKEKKSYVTDELRKAGDLQKDIEIEMYFSDFWQDMEKDIPSPEMNENEESIMRSGLRDMGGLHVNHTESINFDDALVDGFKIQENHFRKQKKTADENKWFNKIEEMNSRIINEVDEYMDEIKGDILGKSHVEQTVKIVLGNINKWNKEHQEIELSKQYTVDMLIYVARHSMPSFRKMNEVYRNKVDVRRRLEEFKDEMKTRFTDTIKKIDQDRTEATLFSKELENLIQGQVDRVLVELLPDDIKERSYALTSKKQFLNKILKDLLMEDAFKTYMEFLDRTSEYFVESLHKYLNQYLFENENKAYSQHAVRTSEEIASNTLEIIKRNAYLENSNRKTWMEKLIQKLEEIFPDIKESMKHVTDSFIRNNVDAHMFYKYLLNSVEKIPIELKQKYTNETKLNPEYAEQIVNQLLEHLRGCQKKCPFCKVLCISVVNGHEQECCNPQHYPIGIRGCTSENKLVTETCNTLVASPERFRYVGSKIKIPLGKQILNFLSHLNPKYKQDIVQFKEYKKVYNDWNIEPDKSFDGSLYWKRVIAKFKRELAVYYNTQPPDTPHEWSEIKMEEAIWSLDKEV